MSIASSKEPARWLELYGSLDGERFADTIVDWRAMTPPEWQSQADSAVAQLRGTGVCKPFEKEYLHVDGRRVPALVGAALVQREPMRWRLKRWFPETYFKQLLKLVRARGAGH